MSGEVNKMVNQHVQDSSSAMGCSLPARALLHLWTRHPLQTASGVRQLLMDEWPADRGT